MECLGWHVAGTNVRYYVGSALLSVLSCTTEYGGLPMVGSGFAVVGDCQQSAVVATVYAEKRNESATNRNLRSSGSENHGRRKWINPKTGCFQFASFRTENESNSSIPLGVTKSRLLSNLLLREEWSKTEVAGKKNVYSYFFVMIGLCVHLPPPYGYSSLPEGGDLRYY